MSNCFKYISKPYSLHELVIGSKFFNEVYKLFCSIDQITSDPKNSNEKTQQIIKEDFETSFNEFLNVFSLLYLEWEIYESHLYYIKQKYLEDKYFPFMCCFLPTILNPYESEDEIERINKLNDLFISYSKIDSKVFPEISTNKLTENERKNVKKTFELHYNNILSNIKEYSIDLYGFLDIHNLSQIEFFKSKMLNQKRTFKVEATLKNKHSNSLTLNLKDSLKEGIYKKLIDKLKFKGIIDNENNILPQGTGYTLNMILSAIGFSLVERELFKNRISAKELCKLLSEEFNLKLTQQSYSYSKQTFQNQYSLNPNLDLVRFINDF